MGIFGLLLLRYTTCHTTPRANTITGKGGRRIGRERWTDTILRKVLYNTKYLQVEAFVPDHPAQPRAVPGEQ